MRQAFPGRAAAIAIMIACVLCASGCASIVESEQSQETSAIDEPILLNKVDDEVSEVGLIPRLFSFSLGPRELFGHVTCTRPARILVRAARLSPHVDSRKILYRFGQFGLQAGEIHSYPSAGWVSSIGRLYSYRLMQLLPGSPGCVVIADGVDVSHDIEVQPALLQVIELVADSKSSRTHVQASVALVRACDRRLLAQNGSSAYFAFARGDVSTAVDALTASLDRTLEDLAKWLISEIPKLTGSPECNTTANPRFEPTAASVTLALRSSLSLSAAPQALR
jgi:ABC-type uncharacterized transport system auxiliary subunit